MRHTHRLFLLLGLFLMFSVFFAFMFYVRKYKPFIPKPSLVDYRISASDSTSYAHTFFYDFENFKNIKLLSSTKSFSGKYAMRVKGKEEFSLLIQKPVSELKLNSLSEARISAWIQSESGQYKLCGKLMFQIVDKANSNKYSFSVNLDEVSPPEGRWFYISGKAVINNYRPESTDVAKVYYWNDYPGEVFIDDVLIVFGNQQIKGQKPFIDETVKDFKYVAKDNQPPYPTIYAQKELAVNLKSAGIQSEDGKAIPEAEEYDKFLTGHFMPGKNKFDQILLIHHYLPFSIIWFNPNKNEFMFSTIDQKTFPMDLTIIQLFAADINGDGLDEIIYISGNPQDIKVYSYNAISKKLELLSKERSQIHNGIKEIQKFRIKGKHSESLFVTDVTGRIFLLSFEKNKWITGSLGNISEASLQYYDSQIVSGNFIKADGNDNILLLYRERRSGKCFYKLFDVDPVTSKNICMQQGNFDSKCDTLNLENKYFVGDFNGDGISELISCDTKWRFTMKLIRFTENKYRIMDNIDFKGFEADHNPKYYENLMIATGHYTDSETISLFTVCKNHRIVPGLPETMGIYTLPHTNPMNGK